MLALFLIALLLGFSNAHQAQIKTSCGTISGTYNAELDVAFFLGIPYARECITQQASTRFPVSFSADAPIGARRWTYAEDLQSNCWEGVLDATQFGNFCVQSGQFIGNAGSEGLSRDREEISSTL